MAIKNMQSSALEESKFNGKPLMKVQPFRLNRKQVVMVQACCRCGATFMFKRNRQRCPRCQGVLISKVVILRG